MHNSQQGFELGFGQTRIEPWGRMMKPFLSVVIPMFNEQQRIGQTLKYILDYLHEQVYTWEVIVVNDGSSDASLKEVRKIKNRKIQLISYAPNRGKGFAIKAGISLARGCLILFCDADNATPFSQVERLLAEKDRYDIVVGSRYLPSSRIILRQPRARIIASRFGNRLIQILALPGLTDTQCGFKLFRAMVAKRLIQKQTIDRWGFDIELLVIARHYGYSIGEVAVDWYNRPDSKIQSPRVFLTTLAELLTVRRNMTRHIYHSS